MAPISRRRFLTGAAAAFVVGCSPDEPDGAALRNDLTLGGGGPPALPALANPGSLIEVDGSSVVELMWDAADGASTYDVELNGLIVAKELPEPGLRLAFGDQQIAPQAGQNSWRVRAANGVGDRWSQPDQFEILSVGQIRARTFDQEDLGPIELTVPSAGSALVVSERFAFGGSGRGVSLHCTDPADTRAYKNHEHFPVSECWVRLCVRAEDWSADGVAVNLARIRSESGASESLMWRTGAGFHSSNVAAAVPVDRGTWTQVQLGVLADGSIELWQFDGIREVLIGRGANPGLTGDKTGMSFGNLNANLRMTFEIWLDEVAVGEHKLPWACPSSDRSTMRRPSLLTADDLGSTFSFVFGSCNNANLVPYTSMAIGAAARADADFVIHLGDHGYPDTAAYRQSTGGYAALWSDLSHESHVARLSRKPWLYLASDHDLGGNNVDRDTLQPFAAKAFASWQNNDRATDDDGRFGHLLVADGAIELIWLEEIAFRSPIGAAQTSSKTCLGPEQLEWFLDRVRTSTADLLIVASQTTIGHISESGWVQYAVERRAIVDACLARDGWTRWLSGDKHTARWAWFDERLVEWGAAAWGEIPQGTPQPAGGVVRSASGPAGAFPTRLAALEELTLPGIVAATSFGQAEIDTVSGIATFTVRDNEGSVRVQRDGTRLEETFDYRSRPWRSA